MTSLVSSVFEKFSFVYQATEEQVSYVLEALRESQLSIDEQREWLSSLAPEIDGGVNNAVITNIVQALIHGVNEPAVNSSIGIKPAEDSVGLAATDRQRISNENTAVTDNIFFLEVLSRRTREATDGEGMHAIYLLLRENILLPMSQLGNKRLTELSGLLDEETFLYVIDTVMSTNEDVVLLDNDQVKDDVMSMLDALSTSAWTAVAAVQEDASDEDEAYEVVRRAESTSPAAGDSSDYCMVASSCGTAAPAASDGSSSPRDAGSSNVLYGHLIDSVAAVVTELWQRCDRSGSDNAGTDARETRDGKSSRDSAPIAEVTRTQATSSEKPQTSAAGQTTEAETASPQARCEGEEEDIETLAGMYPQIPIHVMRYLLEVKCNGSRMAAVEYITEELYGEGNGEDDSSSAGAGNEMQQNDSNSNVGAGGSLSREAAVIQKFVKMKRQYEIKSRQQQNAKQQRERRLRESILHRYDQQVVRPKFDDRGREYRAKYDAARMINGSGALGHGRGSAGSGVASSSCSSIWKSLNSSSSSSGRIRYLDNQVVSNKGEKVITILPAGFDEKYAGKLRGKENKGSLAKAAKAKQAKASSSR